MEHENGKVSFFNETNYVYWKIRMSAYLQSINPRVWDIFLDEEYAVFATRVSQHKIDQYDANSKAGNTLFASLCLIEFDCVSCLDTTHAIWSNLERYHERFSNVKTQLFETHHHKYENLL